MPGLIRDVTLVSGDSHLGVRMNDINFVNKVRVLAQYISVFVCRCGNVHFCSGRTKEEKRVSFNFHYGHIKLSCKLDQAAL